MSSDKKQTLSSILKTYYREKNNQPQNAAVTSNEIRTYDRKIKKLFKDIGLDIDSLLIDNYYYVHDSEKEIKTILDNIGNPLIVSIQKKKYIGYKELLLNPELLQDINGAKELANALRSFMDKNGFKVSYNDCQTKEEFNDALVERIDKDVSFYKVDAKLNQIDNSIKVELYDILTEISEYIEDTSLDESKDVMNKDFVLEKLEVLKQDLQTCLNKYKVHFDILYNEALLSYNSEWYKEYEYIPVEAVEYNEPTFNNENVKKDKDK